MPPYAELVCRSNFSFLKGASHPEELVARAKALGLTALALTDDDGLYAAAKAHLAAKAVGLKFILGTRLTLTDGPPLVVYAKDAEGYRHLCQLLSASRLRHPKGQAGLSWTEVAERAGGLVALLPAPADARQVAPLAEAFPRGFYVGLTRHLSAGDARRAAEAQSLARALAVPLCVHNDVHTHGRHRQALHDVLTAIRLGLPVSQAGTALLPNGERTLKGPEEMARLFPQAPEALERTLEIAGACHATLDALRYHFSEELLPPGHTPASYLHQLTQEGLAWRYPLGVPDDVRRQVAHELTLVEALDFPGYFLALWDIVRFARERGILCQGRGSAANSAVCYALGITAIDPVRMGLLFERFLSMERREPPDIDIDFEHERREEVLQYVYAKHGRHRAGMVCTVITYRGRLAVREVGKALGLSLDQVDRLAKMTGGEDLSPEGLKRAGLNAQDARVQHTVALAEELRGFPRHLSIHTGGFVITSEPLSDIIPLENAAMPGRTVIQWEKDDINALGVLKVDLLALGMLTAISKCLALIQLHTGRELSLATIPPEEPAVYEMLCAADAIGTFQVESRAQLQMLPRLAPRCFYDLVIEVAIIRPGPIVGDMVHPFLRRRRGEETPDYPTPEVERILSKTLGVPLFQEQAMQLAMVAAGFSAGEADALRRALSHKRATELIGEFGERFINGCVARGYARAYAKGLFASFRGFAEYGFPESHSASFALITYASSWLKCHYPQAFCAALLNSQPMGFYAPHTLVADAERHGVRVRPVDVEASAWDCTLEPDATSAGGLALRLGLRMVKGLPESVGRRIPEARERGGPFERIGELARRARTPRHELTRLGLANALVALSPGRREALWEIQSLSSLDEGDLFFGMPLDGTLPARPPMTPAERITADFDRVGLSLEAHPLSLLRPQLDAMGALTAEALQRVPAGRAVRIGGLRICLQRPPTAKGIAFVSLEDETGIANLVVMPQLVEHYRQELFGSLFLLGDGMLERVGRVVNVKIQRLSSLQMEAGALAPRIRARSP